MYNTCFNFVIIIFNSVRIDMCINTSRLNVIIIIHISVQRNIRRVRPADEKKNLSKNVTNR